MKLDIKVKSRKLKCNLCKKSTGKIFFYFLIWDTEMKPYHEECKNKILKSKKE